MTTHTTTLTIEGMHCGGCATKIRAKLMALPGVSDASVASEAGSASVTSTTPIERSSLREAVASAGDYRVTSISTGDQAGDRIKAGTATKPTSGPPSEPPESLYPLFLIVGFIAGVTTLIAAATGVWAIEPIMRHFMAGFFIVFSFFKLLDPPGFVSAYRGYDLIARKLPAWGWAYPFVELALGVAYLLALVPIVTNVVTLVLMLVGAAGVLKALLDKRAIRCACLGTALNLPMTKVTLVEDLTMAAMAAAMLLLRAV